ncbi:hypothetical protein [Streptomyces aureus]|uniref:hypothetical protein n=1 Tax=Streptomyces aureus TaxID=193461 RepID=UPI00055DA0B3|nr:hypothetical protein [Streptomyces aureus]
MLQVSTLIQETASPRTSAAAAITPNASSGYLRRAISGSADSTTKPQGADDRGSYVDPGTGGTGRSGGRMPRPSDTARELIRTGPSPG